MRGFPHLLFVHHLTPVGHHLFVQLQCCDLNMCILHACVAFYLPGQCIGYWGCWAYAHLFMHPHKIRMTECRTESSHKYNPYGYHSWNPGRVNSHLWEISTSPIYFIFSEYIWFLQNKGLNRAFLNFLEWKSQNSWKLIYWYLKNSILGTKLQRLRELYTVGTAYLYMFFILPSGMGFAAKSSLF